MNKKESVPLNLGKVSSRRNFLHFFGCSGLVAYLDSTYAFLFGNPQTQPGHRQLSKVQRNTPPQLSQWGVTFADVTSEAGLGDALNVFGGVDTKNYLLEEMGCGAAFFDYDNDGWLDIFLVNGTTFEEFPPGKGPRCYLFHNNRNRTFTDVTAKAGLIRTGWGQGCCMGDYDNDGYDDLFVTYWGQNALYHNNGDGTFTDVTEKSGLLQTGPRPRWNTGACWLDYDRDGHLDLFVANYVNFDPAVVPRHGENPYCLYSGIPTACGPQAVSYTHLTLPTICSV